MSYLNQRLEQYQIIDHNDIEIGIPYELYDHVQPKVKSKYFEADNDDNIIINYIDLNGNYQLYEKTRNGRPVNEIFKRTRIKNPIGRKYDQPPKSGVHLYFTPGIIKKYQNKKHIDTLFIVEGEFKAFVADIHLKIDIIGIGGIHNYINKETQELHTDIQELLKVCTIDKIVLLFDADCLSVQYEENKDLSKRLYSFYTAVSRFKELLPNKTDVFFSHISTNLVDVAKGIDDLIIHNDTDKAKLISELKKLASGKKRQYINCFPLSRKSNSQLKEYFSIDTPESFYKEHKETIQANEFIFARHVYQHDGEKLKLKKHNDSKLYVRIGTDYFKRVFDLDRYNEIEENLKKWTIGTIKSDYKKYPDFIDQIEKFDSFSNIPDNSENYKKIHEITVGENRSKSYNLYVKPNYNLQPGIYENIYSYLKHITNSDGLNVNKLGDPLTIMLDYLTILYRHPKNILPVPTLVSKVQKTGKSTLLYLLKLIYKSNATILNQELFDMSFNAHYIQKLIVGLDEVKIKTKEQKNKIKQMTTTSGKSYIHFKGVDPIEIETYIKLVMASNDERDFMNIESEDVRFWVHKVPIIEKRDPDYQDKMKLEIPAFLHFISNRDIIHPNEDRGWFADRYLQTDQRNIIIKTTKPAIQRDIEEYLNNYFSEYDVQVLKIGLSEICEQIHKFSKYNHSKVDIRNVLADVYKTTLSKETQRFKFIIGFNDLGGRSVNYNLKEGIGKYYTFDRSDWIEENEEEICINKTKSIEISKSKIFEIENTETVQIEEFEDFNEMTPYF
jgi:hypothetical protein